MEDTLPRDFSRNPMPWIVIYFASGIALSHFVAWPTHAWYLAIAGVLAVAICVFRRDAMCVIVPMIFVPLGAACYQLETKFIPHDRIRTIYSDGRINSGEPVELEGVLLAPAEPSYEGAFLRLRVDRILYKGKNEVVSGDVRLFVSLAGGETVADYDRLELEYGSRIRVLCRLEREDRYRNPGVQSRIEILDRQGIDATGIVKSPLLIEKIGEDPIPLPLLWIHRQRQNLIAAFLEHFSTPTAGVLIASLLGNKNFLDRDTAEAFREGGTFHVLVISGLHITFIGGVLLWVLSIFSLRRIWQYLLTAGFLWAYTFAVGAEVPVVRASLMFSFLLFSQAIYRSGTLVNAFATCTLVLLVWRPSDLFTPSFQLTVVSVAAIVGCAFPLIEKMRAIGRWTPTVQTPLPANVGKRTRQFCELLYWNRVEWEIEMGRQIWSANLFKWSYVQGINKPNLQSIVAYVFEGMLVSIIVAIWMLPLLVIHFHRVTPGAIVLNIWVGAFLALESFAGVGAAFLSATSSWLAAPLIALTEFSNSAMLWLPSSFAGDDMASFRSPVYPGFGKMIYLAYAACVATIAVRVFRWDPFVLNLPALRNWTVAPGILTILLGSAIIFHPYSEPSPDGRLQVEFLDVGQGDSALVTFPDGETMLVDGGGQIDFRNHDDENFEPDKPRIGEAVVSEFLWEKGYSEIDYLLVTHADADHLQGLIDVAENFKVRTLLIGKSESDDPQFLRLMNVAERRRIKIANVGRDDELFISDARVLVLNPFRESISTSESANNGSVVIRIEYGSRSFLMTGDIELYAENELLNTSTQHLRSNIVKVPHHGSRTSSSPDFVDEVLPGLAIVSVGRRSRFGHPHPEVVERWRNAGAEILTTGEKGTITVSTDGSDLRIRTFVP